MNYRYSNKNAFSWALGELLEHAGLWLALVAIRLFPLFGLLLALAIPVLLPVQAMTAWSPFAGQWSPEVVGSLMSWMTPSGVVLSIILFASFSFIFAAVWTGGIALSLDIYDDGHSTLRRFWAYMFAYAWRSWLLFLLLGLIVLCGLICFVVPGLWLLLRLWFAPYVLVDLSVGPVDACKASWRMTRGMTTKLAVTALVLFFIGGALWSTFWLFNFVYPFTLLVRTYIYRSMRLYQNTIDEVELVAVF